MAPLLVQPPLLPLSLVQPLLGRQLVLRASPQLLLLEVQVLLTPPQPLLVEVQLLLQSPSRLQVPVALPPPLPVVPAPREVPLGLLQLLAQPPSLALGLWPTSGCPTVPHRHAPRNASASCSRLILKCPTLSKSFLWAGWTEPLYPEFPFFLLPLPQPLPQTLRPSLMV